MITRKEVNRAIAHLGDIELIKGSGYFYFIGNAVSTSASGVYVNSLNELSLDEWIAEAQSVIE